MATDRKRFVIYADHGKIFTNRASVVRRYQEQGYFVRLNH